MEELMELLSAIKPEIDFETEKELIDDGLLESFDVITLIAEIEDQFGIEFEGPAPLFLEVPAVEVAVFSLVVAFGLAVAAPECIRQSKGATVSATADTGILAYAYNTLLVLTCRSVKSIAVSRIYLEPAPLL